MKRIRTKGFTLIEVLVVVAIIGILAAISIMYYQTALTRARQKRTMADMRTIAMAWESRATDLRQYNAAGSISVPPSALLAGEISGLLVPTYIKVLPRTDAWDRPFAFNTDQPVGGAPASDYMIRSAGRDGVFERTYTGGATDDPDTDIVYSGGNFVVYPQSGR